MLDNFDNIIFDLGGVILNIDPSRTVEAFSTIAGISASVIYQKGSQSTIFDDYEEGKLSSEEFRDGVRDLLKISCSDAELDLAWNAMLLDIPLSRIKILQNLKTKKNIYLLSNTNEIHHQQIEIIFSQSYGQLFNSISDLFHQTYFSYLMKDRKPNPSIFQQVIDEQKLDPNRTLFIDDNQGNIEGAKTTQLQTLYLDKSSNLEDLEIFNF